MVSHVYSHVVNRNSLILYKTDRIENITPFSDGFAIILAVPVIYMDVIYDSVATGDTYILIINNILYITDTEKNLLPPIMMSLNGLVVDECPKFMCFDLAIKPHSIFLVDSNVRLPLDIHGTNSYVPTIIPK